MNRKKPFFILILLPLLFLESDLTAGITNTGTTAAQFLKIEMGSRAIGMGSAYVALATDVSAIYWNPAGLAHIGPNGAVGFMHSDWLADINFDFAAAILRTKNLGTFGLSLTALSMPDMKVRDEFEPEGTGEYFSASDMAIGVSYARSFTYRFSMGITGKYIRQQIWHMVASSVAFDLGILFRTDFDWLVLGISVSNFGSKMQYSGKDIFVNYDFDPEQWGDNENIFANLQTDKWNLPLLFRFGIGMEILKTNMNQLTASLEARHPNDNTENLSFGLEYGFRKRFFLRGGYQALYEDQSEKGFTFGAGFVYYFSSSVPLFLDYAYADWGRLTSVNRFSFEIHF
jgi:hypothetical protein